MLNRANQARTANNLKCSVPQNFNEVIRKGDLQTGHLQCVTSDHHSKRVHESEGILCSFSRSLIWVQPTATVIKCHCPFNALHETSLIFYWFFGSKACCSRVVPEAGDFIPSQAETPVKDWLSGGTPSRKLCPQQMRGQDATSLHMQEWFLHYCQMLISTLMLVFLGKYKSRQSSQCLL